MRLPRGGLVNFSTQTLSVPEIQINNFPSRRIKMTPLDFKQTEDRQLENTEEFIVQSLTRLDKTALGISLGTVLGLAIFLSTNLLIFKGGEVIGPNLVLLNQYFAGFDISFTGSLIGFFYGFVSGFILGWLIAFLRNSVIRIYIAFLRLKGNMSAVNDFIDNP